MSNATPGEWEPSQGVDDEDDRWIVTASDKSGRRFLIATIENGAPGDTLRTEAVNARVMAASKDLLQELTDFHSRQISQGFHDCDGVPGGCPVAKVLAKAKGEPPPEPPPIKGPCGKTTDDCDDPTCRDHIPF